MENLTIKIIDKGYKKEKVITFRHLRKSCCSPDSRTEQELRGHLIEDCLSRGYVPMNVTFERVMEFDIHRVEKVEFDRAYCYAGYAGKKSAREIYAKNKELKMPNVINLKSHAQ